MSAIPSTPPESSPIHLRATLADLVERARTLIVSGERRLLGIAGAPGAGKSTLCAALAGALGSRAAVVGMDGFHLANAELERLGRRGRKGAPDTFDAAGYAALLERLRGGGETVYAPVFNRELEESIASAVPVFEDTPLIITEGNYLLLDGGPWGRIKGLLDAAWFLDLPDEVRLPRLVARHEAFGKPSPEAARWVEQVDQRNAEVIWASRARADLIVQLTD